MSRRSSKYLCRWVEECGETRRRGETGPCLAIYHHAIYSTPSQTSKKEQIFEFHTDVVVENPSSPTGQWIFLCSASISVSRAVQFECAAVGQCEVPYLWRQVCVQWPGRTSATHSHTPHLITPHHPPHCFGGANQAPLLLPKRNFCRPRSRHSSTPSRSTADTKTPLASTSGLLSSF